MANSPSVTSAVYQQDLPYTWRPPILKCDRALIVGWIHRRIREGVTVVVEKPSSGSAESRRGIHKGTVVISKEG